MKKLILVPLLILALAGSFAFADVTPTPTPTMTPTATLTPAITPTPTVTPVMSPTVTPTVTPTVIPTPGTVSCTYGPGMLLKEGVSHDDVKQLQSFLSQDSKIYPQGLVTGFFGTMTKNALERLQKQYRLPETGELDADTRQIVFPCATVQVTSPNGGETFHVGDTMHIAWILALPEPQVLGTSTSIIPMMRIRGESEDEGRGGKGNGNENENNGDLARTQNWAMNPAGIMHPFSPVLSIDLMMDSSSTQQEQFVFHVRNVSTQGNIGNSFDWTIPRNIPESTQYRIRIGTGRVFRKDDSCDEEHGACAPMPMMEMNAPSWGAFDESNGVFSILGGTVLPIPSTNPLPNASTSAENLLRMKTQVMNMIQKMQDVLNQINAALQTIGVTIQ